MKSLIFILLGFALLAINPAQVLGFDNDVETEVAILVDNHQIEAQTTSDLDIVIFVNGTSYFDRLADGAENVSNPQPKQELTALSSQEVEFERTLFSNFGYYLNITTVNRTDSPMIAPLRGIGNYTKLFSFDSINELHVYFMSAVC